MIQDIIVNLLIIAALSNVAYHLVKLTGRKNATSACGGCSDCEIKKKIIRKKAISN
jgi:hypothetical protein